MPNTRTSPAHQAHQAHRARLVLWHLTDSALPTGSFAHSAGLETYVHDGRVSTAEEFGHWLQGYLYQATRTEALALRLAVELHESGGDAAHLEYLDQIAYASQVPRQVRESLAAMGHRWSKVASIVEPDDALVQAYAEGLRARRMHGNPGIAAGLVMAAVGVDKPAAIAAYLMQMTTSMTQNAIRAIPLGQDAGQRVVVAAYPIIERATEMTLVLPPGVLGVTSPALEIAQMQHESLHARMFMS